MPLTARSFLEAQRMKAEAKDRKAARTKKRKTLYSGKPQAVSRTALRLKLDNLWAFYVRLRDRLQWGGKCRVGMAQDCRGAGSVAYHLVPRGRSDATRWHPKNGVLACPPCNMGEQMNRQLYTRHHEKLFGRDEMDWLNELADAGAKFSRQDLMDKATELRRMIEALGAGPK